MYDNVGRASTLAGPYEQGTGQPTIRFAYHPQAPVPYALSQHIDKDAAGTIRDPIETLLFTDGLKRLRDSRADAERRTRCDGLAGLVPGYAP